MKNEKAIYILDPALSWKTFKLLQDILPKDTGPAPIHGDRMLWQLLRDKQINLWFESRDDLMIGTSLPKGRKFYLLKNPKNEKTKNNKL